MESDVVSLKDVLRSTAVGPVPCTAQGFHVGITSWHRDITEGSTDIGEQQEQETLTCKIKE